NHPQEQYDLASIFDERGEFEKAIKHYDLANQLARDNLEWHFRYARILDRYAEIQHEKGDAKARDKYATMAVAEYNRTLQLNLNYAPAYYYRGLITRKYKQIGGELYRFAQIAEDFKQVVELEPDNVDALYNLGLTYLDLDKRTEAKSAFEKILALNPKFKGVNLQLGLIAEWQKRLDEAISYYEKEIQLDDNATEAHQHLATLYLTHKLDFPKAEREFQKALSQDPNHVPTLIHYGNLLYNQERYNAAAEQFEIAVHVKPEDPTANYYLALMYETAGKTNLAIAQWKRFLQLNPPEQWAEKAQQHLNKLEK
ncbi:MAG: tetratricopeptide repeat protein, partial [Candidatus Poribacteria bacterium]